MNRSPVVLPKMIRHVWSRETQTMRVPILIHSQTKAIAQWADKQPDPVAAMQPILDWIESQNQLK